MASSLLQRAALTAMMCALSACTTSNNAGTSFPNQIAGSCDPGTQVQLASPANGQGVSGSGISQIVVVANGNGNVLYNTYQSWNLVLTDNLGNQFVSGSLNLANNNGYPQPYPSDYYYSAGVSNLPSGRTYTVGLNIYTSNCSATSIGSFST